jgi:AmmeMemoRadiSam system protein B/AmmeMemoRadiSam system protein A
MIFTSFNCKSKTSNNKIRKPAVAGSFYPLNKNDLKSEINKYISEIKLDINENRSLKALIVPHAGYIYSGPVAATGFALLKNKNFKKTIIIGPSHYVYLKKASIPQVEYYETPLGLQKLSKISKDLLNEKCFEYNPEAHIKEHCIEVEIPFLQTVMKNTEIIPIITGQSQIDEITETLIKLIDNDTIIIISSDLSHFHSYKDAVRLDKQCIDCILKNDLKNIYNQEACGLYPIIILMKIAKHFNWEAKLLDLRNSGDTSGSKQRVVGYGSVAFYKKDKNDFTLSEDDKKKLFLLARNSIIKKNKNIDISKYRLSDSLKEKKGCFVTLYLNNKLRGCIGYIMPQKSLYQAVVDNAYNAAYKDPRFVPVKKDEIKNLKIEISVLTIPEKINYYSKDQLIEKLTPKIDGVIINKDNRSATYLPQVWDKIPEKEIFLESLCLKAGIDPDTWDYDKPDIFIYKVFAFHE